jgi:ATP-dependent DNA ligase
MGVRTQTGRVPRPRIKARGGVRLRSRNDKEFASRYPVIAEAARRIPTETMIDGEVIALDASGRPSFNLLQYFGSSSVPIYYYAFDLPMLAGRDLKSLPLTERRELLRTEVLSDLADPIRFSPTLDSTLDQSIRSVRDQKFEGLIAKRRDSQYEPGQRSGTWLKMRVNQGQEFVIGGYTPTAKNFDALISATTKKANSCTCPAPGMDSHPLPVTSCSCASRACRSISVPVQICQRAAVGVGARV